MKHLFRITLLIAVCAFVAGCCNCRSYQKKTNRPLAGTEWQLIQLGGGSVQPVEGKFAMTLDAAEKRVSGIGACNRFSATYEATDKRALTFSPLISTRMACPDMATENKFFKALEQTTHYDMDGPMLLLLGDGELKAVFQAK